VRSRRASPGESAVEVLDRTLEDLGELFHVLARELHLAGESAKRRELVPTGEARDIRERKPEVGDMVHHPFVERPFMVTTSRHAVSTTVSEGIAQEVFMK